MNKLSRFGVSIERELLNTFDRLIGEHKYPTRSKAIEDLIRREVTGKKNRAAEKVVGTIIFIYDHHRRDLTNKIVDVQHDLQHVIISSQHVHLDHHNCLEVVIVRGKSKEIEELFNNLRSVKGIKNAALNIAAIEK